MTDARHQLATKLRHAAKQLDDGQCPGIALVWLETPGAPVVASHCADLFASYTIVGGLERAMFDLMLAQRATEEAARQKAKPKILVPRGMA